MSAARATSDGSVPPRRDRAPLWRRWFGRIVDRSIERRTARSLLALDDHLLDDIGLSRAQAEELVRSGRLFDTRW